MYSMCIERIGELSDRLLCMVEDRYNNNKVDIGLYWSIKYKLNNAIAEARDRLSESRVYNKDKLEELGKLSNNINQEYMYIEGNSDVLPKRFTDYLKKGKALRVSWGKNKNATNYTIYGSTNRKGKFKKIATTKKTFYVVKKVGKSKIKKNKNYYFYVKANRKQGKKTIKSINKFTYYSYIW